MPFAPTNATAVLSGLSDTRCRTVSLNRISMKTIIYGSCPRCNGDGYVVVGRILWNPVKTDCPAESCKDGRVVISVVEERR